MSAAFLNTSAFPGDGLVAAQQPRSACPLRMQVNVAQSGGSGSSVGTFSVPTFANPAVFDGAARDYDFQRRAAGQGATAFDVRRTADSTAKNANERVNDIGTFRNMDLYTDSLVWARGGTDEVIAAALKQVLGNVHLFESDMAEFADAISTFKISGDVKEFVRALGQSAAYKKRFFDAVSPMRFVELNFKHFLGRAPRSQAEYAAHMATLQQQGYAAEINSYVDSAEYDSLYGRTRVPATNFRGGHETNNEMNRIAVLNGPYSSSDRSLGSAPKFAAIDATSGVDVDGVLAGLPTAWAGENKSRARAGLSFKAPGVQDVPPLLEADALAWKAKLGSWVKYWYADSLPYEELFTPVTTVSDEEEMEAEAVLKYGSLSAKFYTGGARKNFDYAPVIEMSPPRGLSEGSLKVGLQKIETTIPSELMQNL